MILPKSPLPSNQTYRWQLRYRKIARQSWLVASLFTLLLTTVPRTSAQETKTPSQGGLNTEPRSLAKPIAPDATDFGPFATTAAEYRFPATIDPDIISDRFTEIWAVVHRPVDLSGGPYPVLIFLHGNHATCGRGFKPRVDDNVSYSSTGTCPPNYVVVPNHRGYDYLAERLASWGYIVVSINANRGINTSAGVQGDAGLNLTRGRLVLKHLQLLSTWNTTGGTPDSLGVDLRGKLDFNNLGLMGHSRGGEGVRAAYNLYRDADSPWPARIPDKLVFKGIFEFAPVDGQTSRTLNIDGVPWNVLLPECDGDVYNLQGVKPFDRVLNIFNENPATLKSTYTVWGANHDYYNTEWQTSDSTGCQNHNPLFIPGPSVGSDAERQTGLASLLAFMRGNIPGSPGFNPNFNQNFNPQFALPETVTAITRIDRGYTSSPNTAITKVLEDFNQPTGTSSAGFPNLTSNITITHDMVPEHDSSLRAGAISWSQAGDDVYFQSNVAAAGQGIDISSYKTLDLRVDNQEFSSTPTDLSVALVLADGSLSRSVSLQGYVDLRGPVGGPLSTHRMLQTARISLTDFRVGRTGVNGVRLIFNKTAQGAIYVANIRLSAVSELLEDVFFLPEAQPTLAAGAILNQEPVTVITNGNKIISIRSVTAAVGLNNSPGVEIEVFSNQPFPVRNEILLLYIGKRKFMLSRYPNNGDMNRLIFTLTEEEFAQVSSGEQIRVQYGSGEPLQYWDFGRLDKTMLDQSH